MRDIDAASLLACPFIVRSNVVFMHVCNVVMCFIFAYTRMTFSQMTRLLQRRNQTIRKEIWLKNYVSASVFFLAFVNQLFGRWGSLNVPRNIIGNWIKVHALVTCVVSILIMRISQLCLIQIYSVRCLGETKISGSFDAGYLRTVAGWLEWEKSGSSNTIERKRKFISHWNSSKCDLVSGCSTGKSRHVWLKNLRR